MTGQIGELAKKYLKLKNISTVLVLCLILFFGNRLRTYNYDVVPHPGETADEYVFAWAGISFFRDGVMESWTGVPAGYYEPDLRIINVDKIFDADSQRVAFSMVKPWFDKPPLLPIFTGLYLKIKNISDYEQTGVAILRRPMLRVAIITSILIFYLSYRWFGAGVAIMSATLYNIIPTTVISSRLLLAENVYIPMFLAALVFMDIFLETKRRKYLILAALISALGMFTKLSAVAIPIALAIIALALSKSSEKLKNAFIVLLVSSVGFWLFVAYGAIVNWQVFRDVFFSQASLFYGAGSEIVYSALTSGKITSDRFFTDGWITMLWIGFLIFVYSYSSKEKRVSTMLSISVFSYLAVFLIFGSESYGWYRFPFYPFLIIGTSKLIFDLVKNPNLLVASVLFFLPFGTSVHRIYGVIGFQDFVFPLRVVTLTALVIFSLGFLYQDRSRLLQQLIIVLFLALTVFLAVREILFYNIDNWFFIT